jgi:4'-phosphopantetheinyl transferase
MGLGANLRTDEVHLWSDDLDVPAERLRYLETLLSGEERERAERFKFPRDRNRFIAGRGRLRELLGAYLRIEPGDVSLVYGPFGKPALRGRELNFNLSHSGARVLFAFCRDTEIGVDVEVFGQLADDELVARQFFAPREVEDLLSLDANQRGEAFLACWTRKEAYIKARGEGLSLPLQKFEVSLLPDQPARLEHTAWSQSEASEWRLHDISALCPSGKAALAVHGDGVRLVPHPTPV